MEKQLTPIATAIEKTRNKIEILKLSARRSDFERDYLQKNMRNKEIQVLIENIELLESLLPKEKESYIKFHVETMKIGLIEEGDQKWMDAYCPKIKGIATKYFNDNFKQK